MVTRVAFGAALLLALLVPGCAPVGPINPVSVPDPYDLSSNNTTIDLTYVPTLKPAPRFISSQTQPPTSAFPDVAAGLLPPVAPTSYTLTLSIVGATITGPTVPPSGNLSLTSPAATVILSDPSLSGVTINLSDPLATWTLQPASSPAGVYTYTVSGASLTVTVTGASTAPALADVVSLTTQGGDNEAAVYFGVSSGDVPSGDTLTLEFGPGSAVYTF